MVRRSRLEMYIDILEVIAKGVSKPTHIMYKANLAWNPTMRYLDYLIGQELIHEEGYESGRRYKITEKGIRVVQYFRNIKEILSKEVKL